MQKPYSPLFLCVFGILCVDVNINSGFSKCVYINIYSNLHRVDDCMFYISMFFLPSLNQETRKIQLSKGFLINQLLSDADLECTI